MEAERREVGEQRFTSLDRIISRACERHGISDLGAGPQFVFALPYRIGKPGFAHVRQRHLAARLSIFRRWDWRSRPDRMLATSEAILPQFFAHAEAPTDSGCSKLRYPSLRRPASHGVTNLRRTPALDGRCSPTAKRIPVASTCFWKDRCQNPLHLSHSRGVQRQGNGKLRRTHSSVSAASLVQRPTGRGHLGPWRRRTIATKQGPFPNIIQRHESV